MSLGKMRPAAMFLRSANRVRQLNCQRIHLGNPLLFGPNVRALMPTSPRMVKALTRSYASLSSSTVDASHRATDQYGQEKLESNPSTATSESSVRPVIESSVRPDEEEDVDMMAGIKSDWRTIKETFALSDVPRETYYIGLAGVLPYLATSLSTFYLAWDIDYAHTNGQGFLLSGHNAELLLHFIEPIQVGYGAVIISFLGAIHWGLEFAGYGGYHYYRRYAVGVVAPAIAWPTILFPVEYALITQFLTFTFLYFTDARATARGWFPSWYASYRFVLTFVVGASIVLSLIGRGKIADKVGKLPGPADHLKGLRGAQTEELEELEEKERRAQMIAEDEHDEE